MPKKNQNVKIIVNAYVVNITVFLISTYTNKKMKKQDLVCYFMSILSTYLVQSDRCIVGVNGDIKDTLSFTKKTSLFLRQMLRKWIHLHNFSKMSKQ